MTRPHQIFSALIDRARGLEPIRVAVAWPLSEVALRGACEAALGDLIIPVLVGPLAEIAALAAQLELDISGYEQVEADSPNAAAAGSVALCRAGQADALMKGSLHTDDLLRAVLEAQTGLRTERRISHTFVLDVPAYARMLLVSDAAINIEPDLAGKLDIVQNAIDLARVLGVELPKVAILSAVETVTPKMRSTIDAAALCKMAERGQITGGILDGPLALDGAINPEAARIKRLTSPVAGVADILIVPDLEVGNVLAKELEYFSDAEAAGIVMGASVPIILTSRSARSKCRLASCAVAAAVVHARRMAKQPILPASRIRHD